MRLILSAAVCLTISGCVHQQPTKSTPTVLPIGQAMALTSDECGRSNYMHLIGQPQSRLFDIPDIPKTSIHYGKGASVAMVGNPKRLNFVNNGGYAAPDVKTPKIVGIFCG